MHKTVIKAKKKSDDLLIGTWDEIKNDLYNAKVKYDDLDTLLKYMFLKQFDDMFMLMKDSSEVKLSEIVYLCRAAKGKYNTYERFIPKEEFKHISRFNPPEEMFIYLGISYESNFIQEHKLNAVEETCLKEVRAVKGSEISLCKFKIKESELDKKVIDISIADEKSFDILMKEVEDISVRIKISENINNRIQGYSSNIGKDDMRMKIKGKSGNAYELTKVLSKIYFKMISEDLFLAVDGLDRNYEYAPFHAFANYFRNKGYSGIVYGSTVNSGNKNLVLFDIHDVVPTEEIKTLIY